MLYPSVGFRPASEEYRDNFDRIFRRAKEEREARAKERSRPQDTDANHPMNLVESLVRVHG